METFSSAAILFSLVVGLIVVGTLVFAAIAFTLYVVVEFFVNWVMSWFEDKEQLIDFADYGPDREILTDRKAAEIIVDHMKGRHS